MLPDVRTDHVLIGLQTVAAYAFDVLADTFIQKDVVSAHDSTLWQVGQFDRADVSEMVYVFGTRLVPGKRKRP